MILLAALAACVGIVLGALGGGGSILMLPILRYVGGFETRVAIASSLVIVAATASFAMIRHARQKRVRFSVGFWMGLAGMVGSFLSAKLSLRIPPRALLIGFALVMLVAGFAMLRQQKTAGQTRAGTEIAILAGFCIGCLAGLVGAGGGFLIVPVLVLLIGMSMPDAIGTSLLVIALQSTSGALGHVTHTSIPWTTVGVCIFAALLGSIAGTRLMHGRDPKTLKRTFGYLVITVAVSMLMREILFANAA